MKQQQFEMIKDCMRAIVIAAEVTYEEFLAKHYEKKSKRLGKKALKYNCEAVIRYANMNHYCDLGLDLCSKYGFDLPE